MECYYAGGHRKSHLCLKKRLLDIGLLTEPVDISKYEFVRMPYKERWGVLVNSDSQLYEKESVSPAELVGIPLIMVQRNSVKKIGRAHV